MSKVPYLSTVGSLQYLAMITHPDIAHSIALLALMPILVHNTRMLSNTSSDMSRALLTTSPLTVVIWLALSPLSHTLMPLMVIVLILVTLLLVL